MKRSLLVVGLLQAAFGALLAGALEGQSALTRVEENLRASPNGVLLGVVQSGTPLLVHDRQDQWLGVELEGWMWDRSLQVRSQSAFDLAVSEPAGENLRAQPSGQILARLAAGTLLDEIERRPGWIRVRRRGWIWAASVGSATSDRGATEASASRSAGSPLRSSVPAPVAGRPVGSGPVAPDAQREPPVEGGVLVVGGRGAAVLDAPMGDTLATALANSSLQVTSREGNWARVRVEGWVWVPPSDSTAQVVPDDALPAQVVADPARFAGRVVRWDLQFISLERAERIRTDFTEGEPFLLTRSVGGARLFVYVAVPPDRLGAVAGLLPLEQIRVVGRVRMGASALTGGPVIELLEIQGRGRSRE